MSLSRRLVVLVACVAPLFAASPLQEKVRAWRVAHERELIDEYRELLAIPNIPVDRANIRRNADFIVAALKRRGIEARLLTAAEQRAVAAIPSVEDALKRELGLARAEVPGRTLFEGFNLPTLSINGIQGANVGAQAANVIPTVARAVLDLRLVQGNDAQRQVAKVVAHIKARGWHVLDRDPTDGERAQHARLIRVETKSAGSNAQRTPLELPIAQSVIAAVQSTVDYPVVLVPTLGGTLPTKLIEDMLGAKILTVPVVNADNNQHAENENVKVQCLWDGLETYAALMTLR